jgi:site-specific recombinase XerD
MRRGELIGMTLDDLGLEDVAFEMGKGRKPRSYPFGSTTAPVLDRYLCARPQSVARCGGAVDGRAISAYRRMCT